MHVDPTMRYMLERQDGNGFPFATFGCYRLREGARTGPYLCRSDLSPDDNTRLTTLAQRFAENP